MKITQIPKAYSEFQTHELLLKAAVFIIIIFFTQNIFIVHLLLFLIHSHTGMCGWSNDLCRLPEKGGPQDPRLPESLPDLRRWLGGCADPREASPAHRHFHLHTVSCHLSTRDVLPPALVPTCPFLRWLPSTPQVLMGDNDVYTIPCEKIWI